MTELSQKKGIFIEFLVLYILNFKPIMFLKPNRWRVKS